MHNVEHKAVAVEVERSVTTNKLRVTLFSNGGNCQVQEFGLSHRSAVSDGGSGVAHSFAAHGLEKYFFRCCALLRS